MKEHIESIVGDLYNTSDSTLILIYYVGSYHNDNFISVIHGFITIQIKTSGYV